MKGGGRGASHDAPPAHRLMSLAEVSSDATHGRYIESPGGEAQISCIDPFLWPIECLAN